MLKLNLDVVLRHMFIAVEENVFDFKKKENPILIVLQHTKILCSVLPFLKEAFDFYICC